MNIQDYLNQADRFAANAGCRITEVDEQHAVAEMTGNVIRFQISHNSK